MNNKACSKCMASKPFDQFHKAAKEPSGLKSRCKSCVREDGKQYRSIHADTRRETTHNYHVKNAVQINAKSADWYARNKEKAKKSRADWRLNNAEKVRADVAKYQDGNAERLRSAAKLWASQNREILNAKSARRIAAQVMATPPWADLTRINRFYEKVAKLRAETGFDYEVDHIVPIQSQVVCGLHCEANLQMLTSRENKTKFNRFWPDMP